MNYLFIQALEDKSQKLIDSKIMVCVVIVV